MSDKILVLFVFHKYDNIVENFFNKCIFKDDNVTFLVIANDLNYKFNLPEYVLTMNRKNIGRDFGGWSEGLLKNNLYKNYDKFIFLNSTIDGPYIPDDKNKTSVGKHITKKTNINWIDFFIAGLRNDVKLYGCTINNAYGSHVQSYAFSTDKEALEYLIKTEIFSITKYKSSARQAQENEIEMSRKILKNNWNIGCLLKCYADIDFRNLVLHDQLLHNDIMYDKYRNNLWNEYELIFVKGNRVKITS